MCTFHILNTRPRGQATSLTQNLEKLGCIVTEYPLLNIIPTPVCYQDLSTHHYDVIICTSVNAITHSQPGFAPLRAAHYIGTGVATSAALRAQGLESVYTPHPCGSEGVLHHPLLGQETAQRILILTGHDYNRHLPDTLQQRGHNVTVIPTYRRVPNLSPITIDTALQMVVLTSIHGLRQLYTLASTTEPHFLHTPLVVVTKAMRKLAKAYQFSDTILVTDEVSDRAILQTVGQYITQHKERL